jgi:hypothetical protein
LKEVLVEENGSARVHSRVVSEPAIRGNSDPEIHGIALRHFYIFLLSFLGFIAWRWSFFFVWDDTSSASYNIYSNSGHLSLNHIFTVLYEPFAYVAGDGYRPISAIIRYLGAAYIYTLGVDVKPFIVVNAALFGISLLLFLSFAGKFVQRESWRWFAALLFFASTPILTASLVLFSGIQLLVVIAMLGTLLVYFRFEETNRKLWLVLLCALLVLGPWVREFIGVTPLLILFHQVLSRRVNKSAVVVSIGFLHALFPTFLTSFAFRNLPIRFVLAMGNVGAFIARPSSASGSLADSLAGLQWRIFLDLFSIIPPSALLLTLTLLLAGLFSLALLRPRKEDIFLLFFFTLTFLPFLKIFNSQVHLGYCALPLSVLIARQFSRGSAITAVRTPVLAVAVLASTDQATNLWSVRNATRVIYSEIGSLAKKFLEFPPGTIVVGNAHHLEDIRFYSHGQIDPWGFPGGIPDQRHWLRSFPEYERLVSSNRNRTILLLDAHLPAIGGQRGAGRVSQALSDHQVLFDDLGQIGTVRYTYPFIDPFRFLLPVSVSTWPGPPDLEFDFYRGPALSGEPFLREVALDYHLYRVTELVSPPRLLDENYYGFNIIGYRNRVFAIPQPEGAFDLDRVRKNGYSAFYEGETTEMVKAAIRDAQKNPK